MFSTRPVPWNREGLVMRFDINYFILLGSTIVIGYYLGLGIRKVRLPSLIGYMLLGILLGTSGLKLLDETSIDRFAFISNITIAFVAFITGMELSVVSLKRLGFGIVTIIFGESIISFLLIAGALYMVTRDLPLSLLLGALGSASAPEGTVNVIQEYKTKGNLTKALYAVVGFDDGLAIIIFGFVAAVAKNILQSEASGAGGKLLTSFVQPVEELLLSFLIGVILGLVFGFMQKMLTQERDSLILVIGFVFVATGLSMVLHLSIILTNLVVGFVFVNTRRQTRVRGVIAQVQTLIPFMFILFFCLAGAQMKLSTLPQLGMIGTVYIISRTVGKMFGARFGAEIGRVEKSLKKYVWLGILSQGGVAIGLSMVVSNDLGKIGTAHAQEVVSAILTCIPATCVFFGIVGPILAKVALTKAGEISAK